MRNPNTRWGNRDFSILQGRGTDTVLRQSSRAPGHQGRWSTSGAKFLICVSAALLLSACSTRNNSPVADAGHAPEAKAQQGQVATSAASLPDPAPLFQTAGADRQSVDAPPPVGGVDFWASDRSHVPAPTTRNLMPNPSFEQGLRYWRGHYSLSNEARFGSRSLLVQNGDGGSTFPIPVLKGHDYTVSFYAKAEKDNTSFVPRIQSALGSGSVSLQNTSKNACILTTDWKRYSFTFKSNTPAVSLQIPAAQCPVWVDGIQLEDANTLSEYTGPQVEGRLLTSDPDGMLALGQKVDARFELSGKPGLSGEVNISVLDYYRQPQFQGKFPFVLGADGLATLPLPFDDKPLGTGVFVLRVDYTLAGQKAGCDYYRFSIMDFLENKQPSKNMFGALITYGHAQSGNFGRNCMRWGFGATSYSFDPRLDRQFRISSFCETIYDKLIPAERRDYCDAMGMWRTMGGKPAGASAWTEFTPERLKRVEDICYDVVKRNPDAPVWGPTCEIECVNPLVMAGKFDEWAKFQAAAYRGIKRANPKAIVLPDTGTSGLNGLRGFREQEGYLRATQGLIRWDAMAAHPYGSIDGTCRNDDLDANTAHFAALMAKYGYGSETPIYYDEGFNLTDTNIPAWGSGGAYDNYRAGRPTYDTGWREYLHAAWVARTYLICFKYWPQVQTFNTWLYDPYIDLHLAPLLVCKVPNTLGHLLPNPRFKADVRPVGGIRGYAFEDGVGNGLVAIWCTLDKVDNGQERGPEMSVRFDGRVPEFIDLMGNVRTPVTKDGTTQIQLTSAPLFIRVPAAGLDKMVKALNAAQIVGAGSALTVDVQPQLDGKMDIVLTNQTNSALAGKLTIGDTLSRFAIPAHGKTDNLLPAQGNSAGDMRSWKKSLAVEFANGKRNEFAWDLSYFYVPHAAKPLPLDPLAPEWDKVPAIAMSNWAGKSTSLQDLEARFQMAWDADNLYLRIQCKDDKFVLTDPARWLAKELYMHDGCVEVYLDTGANGRSNPGKGYDLDDYRYDVYAGDARAVDGPGSVYRLREAEHQLAGGLNMPTKDEAAKGVKCQFQRSGNSYAYVLIFPQRYIEPLRLEKGWRAGFALYIHDKEPGEEWPRKGLSLATQPGSHCDYKPHLWPVMVLGE